MKKCIKINKKIQCRLLRRKVVKNHFILEFSHKLVEKYFGMNVMAFYGSQIQKQYSASFFPPRDTC